MSTSTIYLFGVLLLAVSVIAAPAITEKAAEGGSPVACPSEEGDEANRLCLKNRLSENGWNSRRRILPRDFDQTENGEKKIEEPITSPGVLAMRQMEIQTVATNGPVARASEEAETVPEPKMSLGEAVEMRDAAETVEDLEQRFAEQAEVLALRSAELAAELRSGEAEEMQEEEDMEPRAVQLSAGSQFKYLNDDGTGEISFSD